MIQSMTGFGSRERVMGAWGKICVELRSANHKFLDTVFHLPEGFLSLEEKIKKEIETRIKRGRLTCVITRLGTKTTYVFINKALLKTYVLRLKNIKEEFQIQDEISLDGLIHLPGVLSLEERVSKLNLWPQLKILVKSALDDLIKMRKKEGSAIFRFLKNRLDLLLADLKVIKLRFKKAIKKRLSKINTDEERVSFLKETDITEEIERLAFHIRNFKNKLYKNGAMGKELDFIAQEMQREANTLGAKSFDAIISGRVIEIKSQIEKMREQVQNIE